MSLGLKELIEGGAGARSGPRRPHDVAEALERVLVGGGAPGRARGGGRVALGGRREGVVLVGRGKGRREGGGHRPVAQLRAREVEERSAASRSTDKCSALTGESLRVVGWSYTDCRRRVALGNLVRYSSSISTSHERCSDMATTTSWGKA